MAKTHIKYWTIKSFGDNLKTFKYRSTMLESLGGNFESIKKHKFHIEGDLVKLETEFIEEKKGPIGMQSIKTLTKLANDLTEINRYIPHGDIVKRNTIWDGKCFVLIDWEPLIEYSNPKNIFFKSTKPYISRSDLEKGKITINTDKISFFYFCRKIIHGWFPTNKFEPAILETKITSKSFHDILEYAVSFPKP